MTHALAAAHVLRKIVSRLSESLPDELKAPPVDAQVLRLDGKSLAQEIKGPFLGVYVYRIRTDRAAAQSAALQSGERLSLHFLLVAEADDPDIEIALMASGMRQLAKAPILTLDCGAPTKSSIVEEDLSTDALIRIWAGMGARFRLSTPYVVLGL